ncbi:MAG: helix-turn-helix domain-containing protein [Candidatus Woesearchaeota archaeon]
MIVQKEFLNKLRDFGINSYEAKLWVALLSRGVSTAGELSDIANVPRSRTYDVLESLEKKGFIIMKIGKPIKYVAVPPEEVIERVKKKIIKETEAKTELLEKFKESKIIEELNQLYNTGIELVDVTELSGAIKGRNNIYNKIESIIKNAESSVIIHTTSTEFIKKLDYLKNTLKKLKEKNVKVRIAAPINKESLETLKELKDIVEVKKAKTNSRFVVVDGKEVVFMVANDKDIHPTYDVGIWVSSEFFASTLENYFNSVWKDLPQP